MYYHVHVRHDIVGHKQSTTLLDYWVVIYLPADRKSHQTYAYLYSESYFWFMMGAQ